MGEPESKGNAETERLRVLHPNCPARMDFNTAECVEHGKPMVSSRYHIQLWRCTLCGLEVWVAQPVSQP